ncbi:molybdenum cofactor biosynthesis protein B [Aeromicrobium sp. CTD01-1L150]|uniref:MogA/MoaB family molybdenum cofactor biosynthesis protein n=1 Tax=Aeromicrobium sp. CTD01-1L150 TaxID=3341830 RepID=UPI0035C03749
MNEGAAEGEIAQEGPEGRGAVVVASNRAARGVYDDTTGPLLVDALRSWGLRTGDPVVVPDGGPVGEAIAAAVVDGVDVVLTTGGTGISPTDRTPDVTRGLLERELPGVAEALRAAGVAKGVPTAALSRGLAGVAGRTLVVNLPGSRGGVKDGIEVLAGIVPHAVEQLRGLDHSADPPPPARHPRRGGAS